MSVQVIGSVLIVGDATTHQARSVGDGNWVVSYLPGRTLTLPQSVAALKVAEFTGPVIGLVAPLAAELGLTALEAIGMAAMPCDWDPPPTEVPARPVRIRRWWP